MLYKIREVFSHFDVNNEKVIAVEECFIGHISRTFFVTTALENEGKKRYVLQKMNEYVFPKMDVLMHNVMSVTDFIRQKAALAGEDETRCTLRFHKLRDGKNYYRDEENAPWRMYDFIEGAETYDACPGPTFFTEVGRSFGKFTKMLADFDTSTIGEVIDNFHNTKDRLRKFREAVEKNLSGRRDGVASEIEFVLSREKTCVSIVDLLEKGVIPMRVTHNDTKLNNILIDTKTQKSVCVIDLDTVMPGSVLYDFGDAIRYGASSAPEDEKDLDKVGMSLDMFEAFATGYVGELKGFITEKEIRLLPLGAVVITLETGMRFLTDYLDGDKYFRVGYPEHNLVRARNQFKLVSDMENKMKDADAIIDRLL